MGPLEIAVRAQRMARDFIRYRFQDWPIALPADGAASAVERPHSSVRRDGTGAGAGPGSVAEAELISLAERLMAGEDSFMGWGWRQVGTPPLWRRDPVTGRDAPGGYGPWINYRDRSRFDEVRRIWELSRHHRWVVLAWAGRASGRSDFQERLSLEILDWCLRNPYLEGPHWTSALEVAIRIISWARVLEACGGELSGEARAALAWGAERSQEFLLDHRSLESAADNHATGEAVGLVVSADAWPSLPAAGRCRRRGWRVLAREVSRQVGADGWPLEQTVSYGVFVLDLLLEVLRSPSAADTREAAAVRDGARALTRCFVFLEGLGEPPEIGDTDEGKALPAPDPAARWDAVLSCAVPYLLGEPRPPRTPWGAVVARRRGLSAAAPNPLRTAEPKAEGHQPASRAFAEGGMVALVDGRLAALVDVGPLGFPPTAGHGHADCLQVLLWLDRLPVLVDPGMPVYFEDRPLRDRYRGTPAHNSLAIGSANQSTIRGPFLWTRQARVVSPEWRLAGVGPWVEASHDGYDVPPWRAVHRRRISLEAASLAVEDRVQADSPVDWSLTWQFHPSCRVEERGEAFLVTCPAGTLLVEVQAEGARALIEAGEVAPRFGASLPAPRLLVRARSAACRTRFSLKA